METLQEEEGLEATVVVVAAVVSVHVSLVLNSLRLKACKSSHFKWSCVLNLCNYFFLSFFSLQVHIKSPFVLNGVCVKWKGYLDMERLDGVGCMEFDEETAKVEDCILREQVEAYNRRAKEFEEYRKQQQRQLAAFMGQHQAAAAAAMAAAAASASSSGGGVTTTTTTSTSTPLSDTSSSSSPSTPTGGGCSNNNNNNQSTEMETTDLLEVIRKCLHTYSHAFALYIFHQKKAGTIFPAYI